MTTRLRSRQPSPVGSDNGKKKLVEFQGGTDIFLLDEYGVLVMLSKWLKNIAIDSRDGDTYMCQKLWPILNRMVEIHYLQIITHRIQEVWDGQILMPFAGVTVLPTNKPMGHVLVALPIILVPGRNRRSAEFG